MTTEPLRPSIWLAEYGRRYPDAWKTIDRFRSMRSEIGGWPVWCFLPMAGAYLIVSGGHREPSLDRIHDVGAVAALAAWRVTQGVYRVDPTVLDALWETQMDGNIPVDILQALPEWCPYIQMDPPRSVVGVPCHGFWAHLEEDAATKRMELRLLLDTDEILIPMVLHLVGTLEESLSATISEVRRQAELKGVRMEDNRFACEMRVDHIEPLLSVVLYLCAQNLEVSRADGRPGAPSFPAPTRTKKGERLFPPAQPTTWEVAFRLGAALRQATAREETIGEGGHARPRPHIRRAHYHTYLTGPRSAPQMPVLRWLPPIAVCVESDAPVVPAVRRVP